MDRKAALYIQEHSGQNSFDALDHAREMSAVRNPQKVEDVTNAVIADGKFIAVTPCGEGKKGHLLDIDMNMPRNEAKEPTSKKRMGCEK